VKKALREFMAGLVDYEGLFPPAGLSMSGAVAEYARWLADPAAWMLGRFVVPAVRLPELDKALAEAGVNGTWRYSVLMGDSGDPQGSLEVLAEQGRLVWDFDERQAGSAGIETLEYPLPADVCQDAATLDHHLDDLLAALAAMETTVPVIYLELPPQSEAQMVAEALARAAERHGDESGEGDRRYPILAVKLRCGGTSPRDFPSTGRMAAVLTSCAAAKVPLKFTGGLQHPLRSRSEDPPVVMHGFINVFGAGLLAHGGLEGKELAACLAETSPEAFSFDDEGFAWRDHAVDVTEIAALRRDFLHGFAGSSFAEPVSELHDLKLA